MKQISKLSTGIYSSSLMSFVRLVLKRPIYIVIGVLVVAFIKFVLRPQPPMPVYEYIASYRVKYSDPGLEERASKSFDRAERLYRPQWAMLNPYDRDMATKHFQSTQVIVEAGEALNYTVNYWHEGDDIYAESPIDLRFLSDSIDAFDYWKMQVEVTKSEVVISGLSGRYIDRPIKSSGSIRIPYDKPIETPVGDVLVRLVRPIGEYEKIKVTKISDVQAQEKYDGKMVRYANGNLIELFLTANCTPEFARDLFAQIGLAYERYARSAYQNDLTTYLDRLSRVKGKLLNPNKREADSLPISIPTTAQGKQTMLEQIERLEQEARTNAMILEEDTLLEMLDDTFIRSAKQGNISGIYITIALILLLFIIPAALTLIELLLRRPVLGVEALPTAWQESEILVPLPTASKPTATDWALTCLALQRHLAGCERKVLLISAHDEDKRSAEIAQAIESNLRQMGESLSTASVKTESEFAEVLTKTSPSSCLLVQTPALDSSVLALSLQQRHGIPLAIIVENARTKGKYVAKLEHWYRGTSLRPIVLWGERI